MASDEAFQRSADEAEIRNLIARIALATDVGDLGEFVSLYAEDATLQMRVVPDLPPDAGIEAILAGSRKRRADGITGPGSGMVHAIQSSAIAVTGDEAKAQTYAVLYRNATSKPEISAIIIYNDAFVRTADGWRLSLRYIDPVPAG
jgi:ketosteroid isomerase-like protein